MITLLLVCAVMGAACTLSALAGGLFFGLMFMEEMEDMRTQLRQANQLARLTNKACQIRLENMEKLYGPNAESNDHEVPRRQQGQPHLDPDGAPEPSGLHPLRGDRSQERGIFGGTGGPQAHNHDYRPVKQEIIIV